MSQRYNDNKKRPKPKENQLGILKVYIFCWKIQLRASRERCRGYISIYENTSEKLQHLPQKILLQCYLGAQGRMQLELNSHRVKAGVKATY